MARLLKITTRSGAEYILDIDDNRITGGSLGIKEGTLQGEVILGEPLMISTWERHPLHPERADPGVASTPVVDVQPI